MEAGDIKDLNIMPPFMGYMSIEKRVVRKFIAGSALVGILAATATAAVTVSGVGLAAKPSPYADLPRINSVPNFRQGFLIGTNTYASNIELAPTVEFNVACPLSGTYHLEMSTNLLDPNGWMKFGKTNQVTVFDNSTNLLYEYTPSNISQMSQVYFRIAGILKVPAQTNLYFNFKN